MAPIYSVVELEWNGKPYVLKPSYALIQRIEQRISLASLLNRCLQNAAPLSQLADLVASCLQAAGCKDPGATGEEIHAQMVANDTAGEALQMAGVRLVLGLMPETKRRAAQGNPQAPAAGATPSTTSAGQSITKSPSDTSGSSPPNSGG
jgi:hypothetical protein